ncbi:alpha/beta hydrolase [Clostridium sp. KNHs214]|uniref:alpha/beta fold hydrolase n=1 Tax=Clostridium sp. KNHs214 TaxID=1540257 RepID=UPI000558CFF6|nr:alpha/beta hydrolase [Clostridium sp. KNHs214]
MIKLSTIKGRKIEYLITGSGENTVVIMLGMGCSMYAWLDIADEISKYAKVIIIHRPGVGNSELHHEGSNTLIAAKDLYSLLTELNINEKVILVGHSYGGLCVQHFARLYPEKVESVLLVESASMYREDKFDKLECPISNKTDSDEIYFKLWTRYSKYTKDKLIEEIKPELSKEELKQPLDIQNELLDFYVRPEIYVNQLSELIDLRNTSGNMNTSGDFPNCPLIILIQDPVYSIKEMVEEGVPKIEAERIVELSQKLSYGLKELSNNSKCTIVKDSNHCINETRPDAVIDSIKELLFI